MEKLHEKQDRLAHAYQGRSVHGTNKSTGPQAMKALPQTREPMNLRRRRPQAPRVPPGDLPAYLRSKPLPHIRPHSNTSHLEEEMEEVTEVPVHPSTRQDVALQGVPRNHQTTQSSRVGPGYPAPDWPYPPKPTPFQDPESRTPLLPILPRPDCRKRPSFDPTALKHAIRYTLATKRFPVFADPSANGTPPPPPFAIPDLPAPDHSIPHSLSTAPTLKS
ncbi:hypothetical protein C0995_004563 [Termitomyces sp. Mi166|nr:hypothetical protein C0995_004563 [Termitomyces sp. Mi166\